MTAAIQVSNKRGLDLPFSPNDSKSREIFAHAIEIFGTLKNLPRGKPSENLQNIHVVEARKFLKTVPQFLRKHRCIQACKRELLAYQLGIASSIFELRCNQGFETFASSPPLASYLAVYNHEIRLDPQQRIMLQQKGRDIQWIMLRSLVQRPQATTPTNQPWFYGPQGIQNKDMFQWNQLEPYKFEDPAAWGNQYVFEFCCCCEEVPQFIGDHSWLRLKTPKGAIYSVGLYRPYKRDKRENYKMPLRVQKGHLMQPDVSEFWNLPIHRIAFTITEAVFHEMKQAIEKDKRQDDQTFQLIGQNCTQYVEKIGRIGNIRLPTEKPMWQLLNKRFGYPRIQTGIETAASKLPSKVNSVFSHCCAFICNTTLLCAGAACVDSEIRQKETPVRPHLNTFRDLCNPNKLNIKHPFTVGHDTKEYVNQLRANPPRHLMI